MPRKKNDATTATAKASGTTRRSKTATGSKTAAAAKPASSTGAKRNAATKPANSAGAKRNAASKPANAAGTKRNTAAKATNSAGAKQNAATKPASSAGTKRNSTAKPKTTKRSPAKNKKARSALSGHPSYSYASAVNSGSVAAPIYVRLQCAQFLEQADGDNPQYQVDAARAASIDELLKLMIVPKGLRQGAVIYDALAGFQWLFIIATLCIVHRDNPSRRRYETAVLEICRKNGKTFLIAVIFLLLLLLEPELSTLYSVAPDGALSRQVESAIRAIISRSPALRDKFRTRRDDITCLLTDSVYAALNYSESRLDGREPNAFLADEVGALPSNYAIEAMQSGQLTILNKLGCIISTKYPTIDNPFEDEVDAAKSALNNDDNDRIFSLLYEPDDTTNWMTNDEILMHGNPLALELPEIMEQLLNRRAGAIRQPARRQNFLTKHCNIIYQGLGTETYISVVDLQKCRTDNIDWSGRSVWVGVDLAESDDNVSVTMLAIENGTVFGHSIAFAPDGKLEEKSERERLDYNRCIERGECIACGDGIIDYSVVEQYVIDLPEKYGVKIVGLGFDLRNAMSSAQKWESAGINTVIVAQNSPTLHPTTKWLRELVLEQKFAYQQNILYEINFQNAKCVRDANLNMFVHKKKSRGKIDMVAATLNALYLLQQDNAAEKTMTWAVQY